MSLLDFFRTPATLPVEVSYDSPEMELLQERLAALELALEDVGWVRLGMEGEREFSREGLDRIMQIARYSYLKNPLINRGVSVNHLRADCVDNVLTFYVNGQQLAQVKDDTLTHGAVGVLAGTFSEPGVDVLFDNFVAIQP